MNESHKAVTDGRDAARAVWMRLAWRLFGAALAIVIVAELFLGTTGQRFGMEGWFGVGAVFGFLSCVVFVALARLVGSVARRPERYYEDRDA